MKLQIKAETKQTQLQKTLSLSYAHMQEKVFMNFSKRQPLDLSKFPSRGKIVSHPNCAELFQDLQISSLEVDASKVSLCLGKGFVFIFGPCSSLPFKIMSPASIMSWILCLSTQQLVVECPGAPE